MRLQRWQAQVSKSGHIHKRGAMRLQNNTPKTKCPNRERIISLINERISEIQKTALDKRIAGKYFTAATLVEATSTNSVANKTVDEYFQTYIQNLNKENRIRYAGMFEVPYSSFIKFNKHLDIPYTPHATPLQLL